MTLAHAPRNRAHLFFFGFFIVVACIVVFLRFVIGPFVLALILAYVFNPSIEALERRGVRRAGVVVSAIAIALVLFALAVWFVLPAIVAQAELLLKMLPEVKSYLETRWLPRLHLFLDKVGMGGHGARPQLSDYFNFSPSDPRSFLSLSSLGESTKLLMSWAVAMILAPVFAFFVMRDFRRLLLRALNLVPPDLRGTFMRFTRDVDHTLRAVLRGQLLVISLLSVLYSTAFFMSGLPAGLVVGLVTGFARIVPYLDLVVGGSLCFLILVTNASATSVVVGVAASFLVIQFLDGLFLTPRIMGQFSGLHPFVIILSVLCFGDWFGFYGVLLAIPMAAVLRVALLNLVEAYRGSQFYRNAPEK